MTAVAADPDRWAHHIGFDDDERVYVSLHRDAHVDVWLLCWTPVNDTGWHDHDISSGAVAVVAGELVENNLRVGSPTLETRVGAGSSFSFGPDHIHRLNGAERGTVSVHAYSPPLWRMGQYAVSPTACCAASRCRTPTSCGRSSTGAGIPGRPGVPALSAGSQPAQKRQERHRSSPAAGAGPPLNGPTTRSVIQPP